MYNFKSTLYQLLSRLITQFEKYFSLANVHNLSIILEGKLKALSKRNIMENTKQLMFSIDSYLRDLVNSIYIVVPDGSEASQG